ncbi:MAG: hypothetical protein HN725_03115 [Alphaproteobacteria bacterium]|nr:hypothetical protein [Alphaproteobacteria bacterium]MBT4083817.1 hypothetical protein [Alphaproteobacteria bacterium]MBT4542879.1 hypothetical protein [Alphaproteobacteria bacterium]MBT7744255.1 hypothetical protein [Alphaproteobacteria bacterium]
MTMECRIDPDRGAVLIHGFNKLTDEEMIEAISKLRLNPDLKPGMPTLSDMTQVEDLAISPYGLAQMAEVMFSTDEDRGDAKAAIVVKANSDTANIFAGMLAGMSERNRLRPEFKVFHDLAEARVWLEIAA